MYMKNEKIYLFVVNTTVLIHCESPASLVQWKCTKHTQVYISEANIRYEHLALDFTLSKNMR